MLEQLVIKPLSLLLIEKAFDEMRVYEGKPSITTVLKILKDSDEFERFKQFDIAGFKQMMQSKAAQGNLLHTAIHDTYKSGKYKSPACPHSKAWMKFYVKE